MSSINGPKPRKRKPYQCKICGQYNHNSSTCPGSGDYFVSSTSIKSGKYLVGTDPAIELGIDRSIYMEYGGNISFERDDLQQAVKKSFLIHCLRAKKNLWLRSKMLFTLCSIQVCNEMSLSKFWKKHYKIGKP